MATLRENMEAIKLEKETKILPENLKAGITAFGVTGTLEGGTIEGDVSTYVKEFTSEEEMRNSTSTLEDGTICKIIEKIDYESNIIDHIGPIPITILPVTIYAAKVNVVKSGTLYYTNSHGEYLTFETKQLSTNVTATVSLSDSTTTITYKYNTELSAYTTTDITEDWIVPFSAPIRATEIGTTLPDFGRAIPIIVHKTILHYIFEYRNEEFIELKDYNDNIAYISQEEGVYPEAKSTGDISLVHTRETDVPIIADTEYPTVHFVKTINKSDIEEGTYTYDNVIKYSTEEPYEKELWQTITIEVTADKIIVTCELCHAESVILNLLVEYLVAGGLVYDTVEYVLNTETNMYEYDGNTEWFFGNYDELQFSAAGISMRCVIVPLCIPTENWNNAFSILCSDKNTLHGIYEYSVENESYNYMQYGFNAKPEYVLEGRKFYNHVTKIGTMKNNGELNYIPSDVEQTIPEGYTSGGIVQGDSNLVAENIKSGVSVFGITGTLEGAGNVPVKLFETVEQMQADTTAKEEDLAVVYRNEVQNATADSQFQTATFPTTVVLPTAMTGSADVMYRATDNSVMFDCWGQLSETMFDMSCYNESGEVRIQYESSDGITYTRTDGGEETVDFGTEIYCPYSDNWNDAIGYFIQVGGQYFDGLYECKSYLDKSIMKFIPLSAVRFDDTELLNNTVFPIWDGKTFIGDYVSLDKIQAIMKKFQDDGVLTVDKLFMYLFLNKNNEICTMISTEGSGKANMELHYNIDPSTKLIKDVVGISSAFYYTTSFGNATVYKLDLDNLTYTAIATVTEQTYTKGSKTGYYRPYTDINTCIIGLYLKDGVLGTDGATGFRMKCINPSQTGFTAQNGIDSTLHITDDGIHATSNNMSGDEVYPKKLGYFVAPNQFTATANEVYEKEFYGKNGVETGTLGNPDNTLADTNAKLYNSIQEKYNNMQPIIVKDGARLDDIKCIPIKYDNTLLIDTSEMTSGRALFMGNNHIKHIPKINTSNMIDLYGMFSDCTAIETIADIDTSSATELTTLFSNCPKLKYIPNIDTSNATSLWMTFAGCETITTIPQLNTSKVTDMRDTFGGCINLIDIPVLDTSSVTQFGSWRYGSTFGNCNSLSNDSLNNILQMCINAVSYTGTKTLKYLGLTQAQATTCTGLSNYEAFTSAGWTTGY